MSGSLRELDRLEDRIRAHRQVRSNVPIVVVEGPSDELVLSPHLGSEVDIFPADGKSNLVTCGRSLRDMRVSGFLLIFDNDFDDPDDILDLADFQNPYDGRDLEAMLISLGVLETVVKHQGSEEKIEHLGGYEQLLEMLSEELLPLTSLRIASARECWALAFDRVDVVSKIDLLSLELNLKNYCAAVYQASDTDASISDIETAASGGNSRGIDHHRGKDMVAMAGIALRRKVGSLPKAATSVELLTNQLHSSAGFALAKSRWMSLLLGRLDSLALGS